MLKNKIKEKSEEIKNNLRTYVLNIGLILCAVGYIVYNFLRFEKSTVGILLIIGSAIVSYIFSIIIKALLGEKGLADGYKDEKYTKRKTKYVKKAELADPFEEKVEDFYERKREEKKAKLRKTILVNSRMKYDDFFNEKGEYIENEIMPKWKYKREIKKNKDYVLPKGTIVLDKRQRKTLKNVIALKIYMPDLFTEYADNLRVYMEKEKTDNQVRAKNNSKNLILGALFTFFGFYYSATIVWNLSNLFTTIFMLGVYFAFGILQYYSNYTYITVDKVNTLDKKDVLLGEFLRENMTKETYETKIQELKNEEKRQTEPFADQPKQEQQVEYVEMTQAELEALKGTK